MSIPLDVDFVDWAKFTELQSAMESAESLKLQLREGDSWVDSYNLRDPYGSAWNWLFELLFSINDVEAVEEFRKLIGNAIGEGEIPWNEMGIFVAAHSPATVSEIAEQMKLQDLEALSAAFPEEERDNLIKYCEDWRKAFSECAAKENRGMVISWGEW